MSAPRPGRLTAGKEPVPILQESGLALAPVSTGTDSLALTGIRSSERPARSESLYRLRYTSDRRNWYQCDIRQDRKIFGKELTYTET